MAEQGTHKPFVVGSTPTLATSYLIVMHAPVRLPRSDRTNALCIKGFFDNPEKQEGKICVLLFLRCSRFFRLLDLFCFPLIG